MSGVPGYNVYGRRGNVVAAENDYVWLPKQYTPQSKYGVILCHGANSPDEFAVDANAVKMAAAISRAGFACIAAVMHGNTWANNTVMADIPNAFTHLKSRAPEINATQFHLIGVSMGAAVAIRFAEENPDLVRSIHGFIPLTDLIGYYADNTNGNQAEIAAAWGVVAPAALPAGADLLANAGNLLDVPGYLYYAGNDALIDSVDVRTFAAAANFMVEGPVGNLGHTDASLGLIGVDAWLEVIEHLESDS